MTTQPRSAGIVSRALAALLDVAVVFVIMAGGYAAVAFVTFLVQVRSFQFPSLSWLFTVPVFLGVAVFYQAFCWTAFGRTIGQMLLGLRVLRRGSDAHLRVVQSLGRALFCTFFPLGLAWVVVSPSRRSVQDIALRTRVIYSR